jgi:hypothetical protein
MRSGDTILIATRLASILILTVIGLLVWFLPWIAAALFVACLTFVAIAVGRNDGFWNAAKLFIKEILFGW